MLDLSSLPNLDETATKAANLIAGLLPRCPIEIGHETTGPVQCDVANPGQLQAGDIDIIASSELGEFQLRFPNALLETMSDVCLPDWRDESDDGFFFKCRLIYALHQLIRPTPLANYEWDFMPAEPSDGTEPVSLWFEFSVEGEVFSATLSIIACDLVGIQQIIPQPGLAQNRLDVAIKSSLFLPSLSLPLSDMQQIAPGDALILPGQYPTDLTTTLDIAGTVRWQCQLRKDNNTDLVVVSLEDSMDNAHSQIEDESPLGDDSKPVEAATFENATDTPVDVVAGDTAALSEIPMKLDFCLASQTLPLSQLEGLAPGVTLDFAFDLAAPIMISANGQTLGKGCLMQIGDRIGVRIEQWAKPAEPPNA